MLTRAPVCRAEARPRSAPPRAAAAQDPARHAGKQGQMLLPREAVICIAPYHGAHEPGGRCCSPSHAGAALRPELDAALMHAELRSLLGGSAGAALTRARAFDAPSAPAVTWEPCGAARVPEAGAAGPPTAGCAGSVAGGGGVGGSSLSGGGRGQQSFLESLRARDALAARRSWAGGKSVNPNLSPVVAGLGSASAAATPPSTSALLLPRQAPSAGLAMGPLPAPGCAAAPDLTLSPPRAAPLSPPRSAMLSPPRASAALCAPCLSPVSPLLPVLAAAVDIAADAAVPAAGTAFARSATPQRRSLAEPVPSAAVRGAEPVCSGSGSAGAGATGQALRPCVQGASTPRAAAGGAQAVPQGQAPAPPLRLSKPAGRGAAGAADDATQNTFFAAVGVALAPARARNPLGPPGRAPGAPRPMSPLDSNPAAAPPRLGSCAGPAPAPRSIPRQAAGGVAAGLLAALQRRSASCQWGALEAEGHAFASAAGMDSERMLADVLRAAERAYSAPLAAA